MLAKRNDLFDVFGLLDWFSPLDYSRPLGPVVDVIEEENHIEVHADVPGFDVKDIVVEVKNGVLNIFGENKENDKKKFSRRERYSKFSRSFSLPDTIDVGGVEAEYKNGVLKIKLNKKEKTESTKIEIKT